MPHSTTVTGGKNLLILFISRLRMKYTRKETQTFQCAHFTKNGHNYSMFQIKKQPTHVVSTLEMISTEFNWEINAIEGLRSAKEANNFKFNWNNFFPLDSRQMSHTIKISAMTFWIRIFNDSKKCLKWFKLAKFKGKKSLFRCAR